MTRLAVLLVLLLVMVPAAILPALTAQAASDTKDDKVQLKKLQALQKEIKAIQKSLTRRHEDRSKLGRELETRERAIAEVGKKIRLHDNDISRLQTDIQALGSRQQALETDRKRQEAHIAEELNAAYRLGKSGPLKLLLNQEDPTHLSRALKYHRYFIEARSTKISHYRATMAELQTLVETINHKQDSLLSAKSSLQEQQSTLSEEQSERQQLLAKIDNELGTENARLKKMQREHTELETLLSRLEQAIQDLTPPSKDPFPKLRGKLPWPITGKVLKSYGAMRAQNLPWKGWLIATDEGAAVKAVHPGRVIFSDYLRGYGLVLIIDHGDQYLSLYAHNQLLLKDTGDWVSGGEAIAQTGKSGGLTDSALYFEIRHNGRPQDPKPWLKARG